MRARYGTASQQWIVYGTGGLRGKGCTRMRPKLHLPVLGHRDAFQVSGGGKRANSDDFCQLECPASFVPCTCAVYACASNLPICSTRSARDACTHCVHGSINRASTNPVHAESPNPAWALLSMRKPRAMAPCAPEECMPLTSDLIGQHEVRFSILTCHTSTPRSSGRVTAAVGGLQDAPSCPACGTQGIQP